MLNASVGINGLKYGYLSGIGFCVICKPADQILNKFENDSFTLVTAVLTNEQFPKNIRAMILLGGRRSKASHITPLSNDGVYIALGPVLVNDLQTPPP